MGEHAWMFGGRGPSSPQTLSHSIATSRKRENHHRPVMELWRVRFMHDIMWYLFVSSLADNLVFDKRYTSSLNDGLEQ